MSSMDYGFKQQQEKPGPLGQTSSGAEIDEFKRMLIDTNPVLLGTTLIVSSISCSPLSPGFDVA
jgi:Cleft lip and palate transmembrane protein 1 (CLPTM1)